jgi:hypothetical protein
MTDLSHISTEELLFDRQECFNDVATCTAVIVQDVNHYGTNDVVVRLNKNLAMIGIIRNELTSRGIDPAQYKGG